MDRSLMLGTARRQGADGDHRPGDDDDTELVYDLAVGRRWLGGGRLSGVWLDRLRRVRIQQLD